ncbi:MAG: hypothetical protein Kow0090_18690 [Myxococcota bacterium]
MSGAKNEAYKVPEESPVIRDEKGRFVVTKAYCQNGHFLITDEYKFEGYPGINLISLYGGKESLVVLSPILNDRSKICPVYPHLAVLDLLCPVCKESFPRLAPCDCGAGAHYRTIYLRTDADIHWSIGVCDAYGCPKSFIREGEEIITEAREAQSTLWGG